MKKFVLAVLMILSLFAISAVAAEWSGYISDLGCAKKNAANAGSEKHAGCAAGCAKKGGALALVAEGGGTVTEISNPDKVRDHAGHKVTVTGKMADGKLTVDSVKM